MPGALLYRENSDTPLHVVEGTAIADGPGWRIRLAEAPDRTAADGLRGAYLEADVPATEAPTGDPTAGSWLWHEIVGLSVAGRDGEELGTVIDIYRVAENDVYVVRGPRGEFDVPAVRDFVDSIDPAQRSLVINGLALDLPPVRPPRPYRAPRPRKGDAARARRHRRGSSCRGVSGRASSSQSGLRGRAGADCRGGVPERRPRLRTDHLSDRWVSRSRSSRSSRR